MSSSPPGLLEGADLRSARLHQLQLQDALWSRCCLDRAHIEGGALGSLQSCSLREARLQGVRIAGLRDCSLRGATLNSVDLRGADLRGCDMQGAQLQDCQLGGAQVQGLVLGQGLSLQLAQELIERGAVWPRLGGALGAWLRGLGVAVAGVCCLGAIALLLLPPAPVPGPTQSFEPAPDAIRQTQAELARLRRDLARAHDSMDGHGGRTWPTLVELQANRFDLDADGPGTELGVLFPEGPPRNLLSASEGGVLPYCNATPDQSTLSGVDTDWHYCPETGRVFASGALTQAPTLSW